MITPRSRPSVDFTVKSDDEQFAIKVQSAKTISMPQEKKQFRELKRNNRAFIIPLVFAPKFSLCGLTKQFAWTNSSLSMVDGLRAHLAHKLTATSCKEADYIYQY